jgi:hypothetical protein
MTQRRAEIIDEVCERLALGKTLSRIYAARDLPDRCTIIRWAVKDSDLADRILTARRLGGLAMFDEETDRLMNATPQTIQVERELAHHVRWSISKPVPDVFSEAGKDRGMNISGQHITISWMNSGEEKTQTLVHDAAPALPPPD